MQTFSNILCICFFLKFSELKGDLIFTSPIRTKELFPTVDGVIEALEKYIDDEENHVNFVEGYLDEWKQEHDYYVEDPEKNLLNHVDLFNFLRKLQTWWPYMHDRGKENFASNFLSPMKNNGSWIWPTEEDMTGIMDSLVNLQQIYHQDANSLAAGIFEGVATNTSLSFEECFMMSERCFATVHYELALQWSTVALQKYFEERHDDEKRISKMLYNIAYCSYATGGLEMALESITTYMKSNPDDIKGKTLQDLITFRLPADHEKNIEKEVQVWVKCQNLCSKFTTEAVIFRHPQLKCRYSSENDFLKIAPLKEEILSVNPKLILFRDVIYDSEIEVLKRESKNRLKELIGEEKSGRSYENTKIAHFKDHECDKISKISQRIQDMTRRAVHANLNRQLELFKYELGGFCVNHQLESIKSNKCGEKFKQRSTVLFHLNDVIHGGSTVFPHLDIAVKPEKGTALVWFNEAKVQFSSCATVAGYKWILTKSL